MQMGFGSRPPLGAYSTVLHGKSIIDKARLILHNVPNSHSFPFPAGEDCMLSRQQFISFGGGGRSHVCANATDTLTDTS